MLQLLSQPEQYQESAAETTEEAKMDERLKPIDRESLRKGYQDKEFEQKEKQSLELLKTAVEFVKQQVREKQEKLQDLERQIKEERINTKQLKEKMYTMNPPPI